MLSAASKSLIRHHLRSPLPRGPPSRFQCSTPSSASPAPTPSSPTSKSPPRSIAAGLGFTGGFLGACAGIGGAVFIVPGLVRYCSLAQPAAAGSAMLAVVSVSGTSAAAHAAAADGSGSTGVNWPVAALISLPAMVTTPFGARFASRVNPRVLRRGLGGFLIALSPLLPAKGYLMEGKGSAKERGEVVDKAERLVQAALVAGGAGIGFAAGMLGIGGGSLMTPLIAVLEPGLPMAVVLGTSFAAMLPPSMVAATVYARLGLVRWEFVPALVAGSVMGAGVGSKAVLKVPEEALRWGFATVFLVMGWRIFRKPIKVPVAGKNITFSSPNFGGKAKPKSY